MNLLERVPVGVRVWLFLIATMLLPIAMGVIGTCRNYSNHFSPDWPWFEVVLAEIVGTVALWLTGNRVVRWLIPVYWLLIWGLMMIVGLFVAAIVFHDAL